MEIPAASASAKLRQSNRTEKRIELTMHQDPGLNFFQI